MGKNSKTPRERYVENRERLKRLHHEKLKSETTPGVSINATPDHSLVKEGPELEPSLDSMREMMSQSQPRVSPDVDQLVKFIEKQPSAGPNAQDPKRAAKKARQRLRKAEERQKDERAESEHAEPSGASARETQPVAVTHHPYPLHQDPYHHGYPATGAQNGGSYFSPQGTYPAYANPSYMPPHYPPPYHSTAPYPPHFMGMAPPPAQPSAPNTSMGLAPRPTAANPAAGVMNLMGALASGGSTAFPPSPATRPSLTKATAAAGGGPQQMVTIRKVSDGLGSDPKVTISLRGDKPEQEELLMTLVNGQVRDKHGNVVSPGEVLAEDGTPLLVGEGGPGAAAPKKRKKKKKKTRRRTSADAGEGGSLDVVASSSKVSSDSGLGGNGCPVDRTEEDEIEWGDDEAEEDGAPGSQEGITVTQEGMSEGMSGLERKEMIVDKVLSLIKAAPLKDFEGNGSYKGKAKEVMYQFAESVFKNRPLVRQEADQSVGGYQISETWIGPSKSSSRIRTRSGTMMSDGGSSLTTVTPTTEEETSTDIPMEEDTPGAGEASPKPSSPCSVPEDTCKPSSSPVEQPPLEPSSVEQPHVDQPPRNQMPRLPPDVSLTPLQDETNNASLRNRIPVRRKSTGESPPPPVVRRPAPQLASTKSGDSTDELLKSLNLSPEISVTRVTGENGKQTIRFQRRNPLPTGTLPLRPSPPPPTESNSGVIVVDGAGTSTALPPSGNNYFPTPPRAPQPMAYPPMGYNTPMHPAHNPAYGPTSGYRLPPPPYGPMGPGPFLPPPASQSTTAVQPPPEDPKSAKSRRQARKNAKKAEKKAQNQGPTKPTQPYAPVNPQGANFPHSAYPPSSTASMCFPPPPSYHHPSMYGYHHHHPPLHPSCCPHLTCNSDNPSSHGVNKAASHVTSTNSSNAPNQAANKAAKKADETKKKNEISAEKFIRVEDLSQEQLEAMSKTQLKKLRRKQREHEEEEAKKQAQASTSAPQPFYSGGGCPYVHHSCCSSVPPAPSCAVCPHQAAVPAAGASPADKDPFSDLGKLIRAFEEFRLERRRREESRGTLSLRGGAEGVAGGERGSGAAEGADGGGATSHAGKKKKKKGKGKDDNVFVPKNVNLEDAALDDTEKEVEAFKRFCLDSVPMQNKEKVVLNIKDILDKMSGGMGGYPGAHSPEKRRGNNRVQP
ncbi:unnamed protein product [Cyprideis torosa]|uniref:Uncharacterized protein n=1 Tax=Cyprideis torosa TaxID=163714 RepID=A0A7R8ZHT3_9CRUS|nr:unnamed protein product [Cyprideis torosa]CAG0883222.1 unnamed protein product [Cyprideis torosa]